MQNSVCYYVLKKGMKTGEQDMPDEDDYFAEDEESSEPKDEEFGAAKAELERRCKAANIPLTEGERLFKEGEKYLRVDLPAGREKCSHYLWNAESIRALLSVPFEEYVFLVPYEAICSYEIGSIEALIFSLGRMSFSMVRRLLLGKGRGEGAEEEEIDISLASPDARFSVSLSPTSTHLKTLISRLQRSTLSLKIDGLSVQRHTDAVDILRRISDSLFFQIDLSMGLALTLVRQRHHPVSRRRRVATSLGELQFPTQEYDEAPISLYWYARSALGMPLLQFLAYYQVAEFYFPTYYQAEAHRKIRRILKDPAFRADRDADIGRVLSSLMRGRGTVGDERSMIRATLQECIDPDELRAFLLSDDNKKEFFSSKTKGLTSTKLPLGDPAADLRNDVADRYRCTMKINPLSPLKIDPPG